ncbi:MAG TPA: DUF3006 domain-containing protein [Negativicutes bacterium]|jgi:hypothetical protein
MRVQVIVDRFEERQAVLLAGDEEVPVLWPRNMLPPNVQEGDILQVDFVIDIEATQQARVAAENLLQEVLKKNQDG